MIRKAISFVFFIALMATGIQCVREGYNETASLKISLVNAPADILTLGAYFISEEIREQTKGKYVPRVFHSGVLSGGKGSTEIELCQQGTIEIHITTTAYLANLVPKTSVFSLPFLFRDMNQVIGFVKSKNPVLDVINKELHDKKLHVIAWWPRGFRQLTNSRRPVRNLKDIQGLKFRVMTNQLFVDNMNAMGAHPVPMDWGEVYNALQLHTIDGQENAEDVIYSSRLYEVQQYMTIWDYSTDLEVVMVNYDWWNGLDDHIRSVIQQVADASTNYQINLLNRNTIALREKINQENVAMYFMDPEDKLEFKKAVHPVWEKYAQIFGASFMESFLKELEKY